MALHKFLFEIKTITNPLQLFNAGIAKSLAKFDQPLKEVSFYPVKCCKVITLAKQDDHTIE